MDLTIPLVNKPEDLMNKLIKNFDKYLPLIAKNFDVLKDKLTVEQLTAVSQYKLEQENAKKQDEFRKIWQQRNSTKSWKRNEKLSRVYERFLGNGQFFKSALKAFKNMAERASNWFFDLLKLLFILAIFDPKGSFLKSIVGFIVRMVVWFINILTKYIPQIIKTIIYLVTEVIPPLLKSVITAIFGAFSNMFHTWANELPEGSILRTIFNLLGDAFGKDGIFTKFFTWLAGLFPIIFLVWGIISTFVKFTPLFTVLSVLVKSLVFILTKALIPAITAVVSVLGWWLVPILAIAALWIWAEKISDFFDSLWERFKNLSEGGKRFVKVLALMLLPLTLIIAAVYGLVKLFKWLKTSKNLMADIKKAWTKFVVEPFKQFIELIKKIGGFFSDIFGGAYSTGAGIFNKILEKITSIVDWIKKIWGRFMEPIKKVFDWIADTIATIGAYISGIGEYGLDFVREKGAATRTAHVEGYKLASKANISSSKVDEVIRGERNRASLNNAEEAFLRYMEKFNQTALQKVKNKQGTAVTESMVANKVTASNVLKVFDLNKTKTNS